MPGPKTTKFLASGDYETFYRLAHALSEQALIGVIGISTRAQALKMLHKMTPLDTFPDPAAAKAAENAALHLSEFAQSTVEEIRRFFWPCLASEEGFHETNQRCWSPYDDQAWDAFFADFVLFMTPRLQTIATFIHQLRAVETLSGVAVRPNGSKHPWKIGEYIPHEPYHGLKVLLSEPGFEAALFNNLESGEHVLLSS
jgi:hypothetical protein